ARYRYAFPHQILDFGRSRRDDAVAPYVGVGVNYTTFYNRRSTAQGNAALGGPTRLLLTSSVGPAGTLSL
ncbi:MAG: hypothetical protein M3O06_11945, partial [Pseudomonadota bacterium]|nr:hypothetical protein [Pseudomonadota bacterium]